MFRYLKALLLAILIGAPGFSLADSIDPTSFAASLAVGESVTVRKTVTITERTTSAVLDVMFIFDVTGSMGSQINAAKAKADDILTALGGFGDLQSGVGWYSDPGFDGVHTDLNAGNTSASSGIDDIGLCTIAGVGSVGCGGDFPEKGFGAIKDAADNASWRAGSNRFIIALGDASFKEPPSGAETMASLAANNVNLLGVSFSSFFTDEIEALGGTAFAATATGDSIADAIIDAVEGSLAEYDEVTVDDLGGGAPGIDVSVTCVSADIGTCSGATAMGDYDRSIERMFEFDVTFTALADGTYAFPTHALVDGGIVASESDRFMVGDGEPPPPPTGVPEPGVLSLLGTGLLGLGVIRRRRRPG